MSDTKPDLTLEELLDGLQSPFWRWFTLECAKEWGESAFGLKVATILKTRKYEDAAPLIQQVTVARQEIDRLFALPKQKLDTMKQAQAHAHAATRPDRRPVGV